MNAKNMAISVFEHVQATMLPVRLPAVPKIPAELKIRRE
jgi:hypothetical protein